MKIENMIKRQKKKFRGRLKEVERMGKVIWRLEKLKKMRVRK